MNFQALAVERELNLRESGRGFMAYSTPRLRGYVEAQGMSFRRSETLMAYVEFEDRYKEFLSVFEIKAEIDETSKFARMSWPGNSVALEGMSQEKQMAVINKAIRETTADINEYVPSVLRDTKAEAGL